MFNVKKRTSLHRLARRSYRNNIERGGTPQNSFVVAVLDVKDKIAGVHGPYVGAPDPHAVVREALGVRQ